MRLLLVGGSELTAWVMGRLVPPDVEVERCSSFEEARQILTNDPPQAVIFDATRSRLPWSSLAGICAEHEPHIPYVCYSFLHGKQEELGVEPCCDAFFTMPLPVEDLRGRIAQLVEAARKHETACCQSDPGPPQEPGEDPS